MSGQGRYEPSVGVLHAVVGAVLVAVGIGALADHLSGDIERMAAIGVAAGGLYLLIAGGVARGLQLARRADPGRAEDSRQGEDLRA